MTVLAALVGALLVAVAGLAAYAWRTRPVAGVLERRLLQTVVVTLRSGAAFKGALHSADRGFVVLRNASVMTAGAAPMVVDGEVIVPLAEVEFLQRP